MDLALDPRTHDMVFGQGPGGATFLVVDGRPAIAQRIKIALLSLLGEWRYDITHGTPWFQAILVKGAARAAVASLLRTRILSVPGVRRLTRFDLRISAEQRTAHLDFAAETDGGPIAETLALIPGGA